MDKETEKKIIALLNDLLLDELTTISHYWLYGLTLNHKSMNKLGDLFLKEATEERSHVELLSKRILQLCGEPIFSCAAISSTNDVKEMVENGIKLEKSAIVKYRSAIKQFEEMTDYTTVAILTDILEDEEGHQTWLSAQSALLEKLGENIYLSRIMKLEQD